MALAASNTEPGVVARAMQPTEQAFLLVLSQAILWTLVPGIVHTAPPPDTVEVYMWARDWILVSNKHPNMAGWLLAIAHYVTGIYGWSAYLLSQICTAATIMFVYLLGREVADQRTASLGAILCCTLGYFNWFTPQFNANIASMPFWAGFVWAFWMARRDGTVLRWLVVGLVAAGLVYCKVSGALLLLVAGAFALYDLRLRRQLLSAGPWAALVVFLALIAPAALEIQQQEFQIFRHAANKSHGHPNPHVFIGAQILVCSIMIIVLALSRRRQQSQPFDVNSAVDNNADGRTFVTVFAVAPLTLLVLQSLIMSSRLRDLWAIPMISFSGLAVLLWAGKRGVEFDNERLRRMVWVVVAVVPLVYGVVKSNVGYDVLPPSTSWPQREMTARFEALWSAQIKSPLRLIGGDALEAGLVALSAKDKPSLLIDMMSRRAPWISAERIARDGMLLVWPVSYKAGDEKRNPLSVDCVVKSESFPFVAIPASKPLVLHYCILPPRA